MAVAHPSERLFAHCFQIVLTTKLTHLSPLKNPGHIGGARAF